MIEIRIFFDSNELEKILFPPRMLLKDEDNIGGIVTVDAQFSVGDVTRLLDSWWMNAPSVNTCTMKKIIGSKRDQG
jgi:hypothetical protein